MIEFRIFQRADNQIGIIGKTKGALRAFVIPSREILLQAILDLGTKTGEVAPVFFDKDDLTPVLGPLLKGSKTRVLQLCSMLKDWEVNGVAKGNLYASLSTYLDESVLSTLQRYLRSRR